MYSCIVDVYCTCSALGGKGRHERDDAHTAVQCGTAVLHSCTERLRPRVEGVGEVGTSGGMRRSQFIIFKKNRCAYGCI